MVLSRLSLTFHFHNQATNQINDYILRPSINIGLKMFQGKKNISQISVQDIINHIDQIALPDLSPAFDWPLENHV